MLMMPLMLSIVERSRFPVFAGPLMMMITVGSGTATNSSLVQKANSNFLTKIITSTYTLFPQEYVISTNQKGSGQINNGNNDEFYYGYNSLFLCINV